MSCTLAASLCDLLQDAGPDHAARTWRQGGVCLHRWMCVVSKLLAVLPKSAVIGLVL